VDSGRCRLISRNHHEFTTFAELSAAIGPAMPGQFVLDGEIVCLGENGCPRFYDLMRRRASQYFYAFDLLWKDGQDLWGLPLIQRKPGSASHGAAGQGTLQHLQRPRAAGTATSPML
jgi:ATP-dependent DNA ligase